MDFNSLRKNQALASSIAALQAEDRRACDLVRRHGCLFFVYTDDWIYSVVREEDRGLSADDVKRHLGARDDTRAHVSAAQKMLLETVRRGRRPLFIDVGSNYGQWLVQAARALRQAGLSVETIAFEPGAAGRLAAANIALNHVPDTELIFAAVSDYDGVAPIFSCAGHTEDNKIVNRPKTARVDPAPCLRLDTVLAGAGRNRDVFIKIDTQGAEWEVLNGLGDYRRSGRVAFVAEFSPKSILPRIRPAKFLEFLSNDYELFELDGHQEVVGEITSDKFDALVERISSQALPYCDLAGVPRNSRLRKALRQALTE